MIIHQYDRNDTATKRAATGSDDLDVATASEKQR